MLPFIFQCCYRRPKFHRENETNGAVYQRNTYTDIESFVPTASFSFYEMNTTADPYSGEGSYYSESIISDPTEDIKHNSYIYNPLYIDHPMKHNREIQRLPGPTITIINTAAERVIEDPHWETVEPLPLQRFSKIDYATARYNNTTSSPSFQLNHIYKNQPNIYFYYSDLSQTSDDEDRFSTISEMSGYDYQTIDIFKPKPYFGNTRTEEENKLSRKQKSVKFFTPFFKYKLAN